jgi:hypothetical protein
MRYRDVSCIKSLCPRLMKCTFWFVNFVNLSEFAPIGADPNYYEFVVNLTSSEPRMDIHNP